jgi:hypothetical protein
MQALRAAATCASSAHVAHAPRGSRCAPAGVAARVVLRGAGAEQLTFAKAAPRGLSSSGRRHLATRTSAALKALLWDCDGVILESEDLHRRAYNAVFAHYKVLVDGKARGFSQRHVHCVSCRRLTHAPQVVVWSEEYYDMLSNTVGGGKPKMRWCVCAACATGSISPLLPRSCGSPARACAATPGGIAEQHRAAVAGTSAKLAGPPARACSTARA